MRFCVRQSNADSELHAESTIQFLESLASLSFDFSELTAPGLIYHDLVNAMVAHAGQCRVLCGHSIACGAP